MQCPDCTTFHFLWCLRIASFGAVTIGLRRDYSWVGLTLRGLGDVIDLFNPNKSLGNIRNAIFVISLGDVREMSGKWVVRFRGRDLYERSIF